MDETSHIKPSKYDSTSGYQNLHSYAWGKKTGGGGDEAVDQNKHL